MWRIKPTNSYYKTQAIIPGLLTKTGMKNFVFTQNSTLTHIAQRHLS